MNLLDKIKLEYVTLKVTNLEKMHSFYETVIGLETIEEQETRVILGINNNKLVELISGYSNDYNTYTGLYHLALLLPTEKDLGMVLNHFIANGYPIEGAADHLFSNAIYLRDPEGNGIEMYVDRDKDKWQYTEDGQVKSDTLQMDIQYFLGLAKNERSSKLPQATTMGHFHLSVRDLEDFEKLYVKILGFHIKTTWHGALFVSKDGYHHHIAANTWTIEEPDNLPENNTGLEKIVISVNNLEVIKKYFQEQNEYEYNIGEKSLLIIDKNGIKLELIENN